MLIRRNLKRVPKFKPINARSKEISSSEHYFLFTTFPYSTATASKNMIMRHLKVCLNITFYSKNCRINAVILLKRKCLVKNLKKMKWWSILISALEALCIQSEFEENKLSFVTKFF